MKTTNRTDKIGCAGPRYAMLLVAITLGAIVAAPARAEGGENNPQVLPPNSSAYGRTYGEWSAAWWQWTMSLRTTAHPLFNTADPSTGQSGKVWFLGGTFVNMTAAPNVVVGQAERSFDLPAGKALFFPILNNEGDSVGMDPLPTLEQLWGLVKYNQDHVTTLQCTIDDRTVNGLADPLNTPYRVQSPVFAFTLPEADNIYQTLGVDVAGNIDPAVADGAFLMVAPLSRGHHTIHFYGELEFTAAADGFDFRFVQDITYHINVVDAASE